MTPLPAGVAAGHPETCAAGLEILEAGGSAADAAVAASLASCVAETVMTGLLGGGHAIHYEAATGAVRNLDCFVTVPSGEGAPLVELQVPFGAELVHYAIGAASCAVPGVPAGLHALWESYGTLPWARLVEPALALARDGATVTPAHASCLAMLAPVFTLDEGARIYSPGGALLQAGDRLEQPGLAVALEAIAEEGAAAVYTGTVAESLVALCEERGGAITRADLAAYEARWSEPEEVAFRGTRFLSRGGLSGVPEALAALPALEGAGETERVLALVELLAGGPTGDGDTTNVVTTDPAGNVCVVTTSLGLGSGDYLPGLDLQLNSMLGEAELLLGPLVPGERMGSMMAPSLALDGDGPALAIGSAGGSRLRTALVGVADAVLRRAPRPAGRGRPAAVPPRRHRPQRRAGGRRGRARGAADGRLGRPGLARPPPLLRRRQPDCACRPGWDPRRSGVARTTT